MWAGAVLVVGQAGCTSPNPGFTEFGSGRHDTRVDGPRTDGAVDGPDRDGPRGDSTIDGDGARADTTVDGPPPDGPRADTTVDAPSPDLPPDGPVADTTNDAPPPQCGKNADCNDFLNCTQDRCINGLCSNTVLANDCLISGFCYAAGNKDAGGCQVCDPTKSQTAWSLVGDGTACPLDNIACTEDICQAGKCEHPIRTNYCLVGNSCYFNGQGVGACEECVADVSQTQLTFVAGKPCASLSTASMCIETGCHGFSESTFEPSGTGISVAGTTIASAAVIPAANNQVWGAGSYANPQYADGRGGFVVRLDDTTKQDLTKYPLLDIHHRMVVGAGDPLLYTSNGWTARSLGGVGATRLRVWGASFGGSDVFFMSGPQSSTSVAMVRCVSTGGTSLSCSSQSGFGNGARIGGGVFGTLSSAGGQGPLWAANSPNGEDIYYSSGNGGWSTNAPSGCDDGTSGSPCSASAGDLFDVYGTGDSNMWVVGSGGLVFHYDGASWTRIIVPNAATAYTFTAVYASTQDSGLVTLAAYRSYTGGTRTIALFNYNPKLDRWYGPIIVRTLVAATNELRDLAGVNHRHLWGVGHVTSGLPARQRGWILRMQ